MHGTCDLLCALTACLPACLTRPLCDAGPVQRAVHKIQAVFQVKAESGNLTVIGQLYGQLPGRLLKLCDGAPVVLQQLPRALVLHRGAPPRRRQR